MQNPQAKDCSCKRICKRDAVGQAESRETGKTLGEAKPTQAEVGRYE